MEKPRSDEGKLKECRVEDRINELRPVMAKPKWIKDDVSFGCGKEKKNCLGLIEDEFKYFYIEHEKPLRCNINVVKCGGNRRGF